MDLSGSSHDSNDNVSVAMKLLVNPNQSMEEQ